MRAKGNSGEHLCTNPPYGYRKDLEGTKRNGLWTKKPLTDILYRWDYKSVAGILERPEYMGCTVNFKTYSKSRRLKKRLNNVPENYRIFPNTQPALVNEKVWQRVQELRENKRRPAKQAGRHSLSTMPSCKYTITSLGVCA